MIYIAMLFMIITNSIFADDGVVEGLIDDAPIEEEEDVSEAEDSDAEISKRKKRSDDDEDLEEDDFDLIEENLGIKVRKAHLYNTKNSYISIILVVTFISAHLFMMKNSRHDEATSLAMMVVVYKPYLNSFPK